MTEIRLLTPDDAGQVIDLHDKALSLLNRPDWVRPEDPSFFTPVLAEGFSYGLFTPEGLVGYALCQTRLEEGDDPSAKIGMQGHAFAKLCGCTIAPQWRGQGWQEKLSHKRIEGARARGYQAFFATAAPGNRASWINLLRAGLGIAVLGEKYGGALRYTLVKTAGAPVGPQQRVDSADLAQQKALLAQGQRAIDYVDGSLIFRAWALL